MKQTEVKQQYEMIKPSLECLRQEADYILRIMLDNGKVKYHSIPSRVKELSSIYGKSERMKAENPFEEINDLVGLRVICLFSSDLSRIRDLILDTFEVLSEDNKIDDYEISSFGYMSIHYIVQLKNEYSGPRYDNIKNKKFEVQVRTMLMDAWANVSHYLDYKNESAVPKALKKDFYALSGLFYIADSHFQMFYHASTESRETLTIDFNKPHPNLNVEINLDSLKAFMTWKFPDRVHSDSSTVSNLVKELLQYGYSSIELINQAVDNAWDAFIEWEKNDPPLTKANGEPTIYQDAGIIRSILRLVNEDYLKSRN